MKKKLFLALLTTLLLLLAATTALAVSPSDYNCPLCGEPCTDWYSYHSGDGTISVHSPACYICNAFVWDTEFLCTPAEGTATCNSPALCSICGSTMWIGSAPDPNAHRICEWQYYSTTQHRKYCTRCWAEETVIYEDHYGGTATCSERAICEGCGRGYGELSTEHAMSEWESISTTQHRKHCTLCWAVETVIFEDHYGGTATCWDLAVCEGCGEPYGDYDFDNHDWGDWEGFSASTHIRVCRDCDAEEEAPHTGGDGSCFPTCEECGWDYLDPDGEHRNMCDWFPESDTQHRRYCLDCGTYESNEYENHYGGTATCTQRAVCEGCGIKYGEYSDVHPWGEWEYLDGTSHQRPCTNPDCHTSDYAEHSGGDGSCWTECEDCGEHYYNAEGQHRTMSGWYYLDGAQHMRHCVDCGYGQEYEDHTGGTATCSVQAVCEVCGKGYGELDDTRHGDFSDWEAYDETQHYRWCLDCGANPEYEDHYGGSATCSSRAICEGCGSRYGDFALDVHLHMSEWRPYADGHERHCLDCRRPTSIERAPHTGDGTCQSACIDCHENFIDPNGEHHLTDWLPVNDTQHERHCDRCYGESTYEYADHVGDGTCTSECKDCGMTFTDPDGTHRLTEWRAHSSKQHIRYCPDCELERTFEYGDHRPNANAEDLPCNKPITCADCRYIMDWGTQHSLAEWMPYSPLQHFRYCIVGGTDHMVEYEDHQGDGSCAPVCTTCNEQYIDADGEHRHMSDWADEGDNHTRICTDCTLDVSIESEAHTFIPATCVSLAYCEICGAERGEIDLTVAGHDYRLDKEEHATCLDTGLLRYICQREGCPEPILEIIAETPGQHLYHNWEPVGDGTHIDHCTACGERVIVPCTIFTAGGFSVCPICGEYEGGLLPVIYACDDDISLPYGTLVVRSGEIPVDGTLYAISVAGSYGGYVVELIAPVIVSIPVELTDFRILGMNGEEVSFTLENGTLTFETAQAGLFLLVPAE